MRTFSLPISLAAAAALLAAGPASAQRITGRVVDNATGQRIAFVQVSLVGADGATVRSTASDSAGYFLLNARAGTFRLRAERIGYGAYESEPIEVRGGETVTVVIRMAPQGIPLPPLEVQARGEERGRSGFERRRALGRGVFLTQDSIRLRTPTIVTDAFYNVPGIVVTEGLSGVGISSMYGRKCLILYVDYWPMPRVTRDLNMIFDIQDVRGIEIYRDMSEIPRELRTAARMLDVWPITTRRGGEACGMAWIWTDRGW